MENFAASQNFPQEKDPSDITHVSSGVSEISGASQTVFTIDVSSGILKKLLLRLLWSLYQKN